MGLKLIDVSEIEMYEEELEKQFFEEFNKTKTISSNDYLGHKSSFTINYNNNFNIWFHYSDNLSFVEYSFGDINHLFKNENINWKINSMKPYIVIKIDHFDITKSNCRFAYDEKTDERFLLLETVYDKNVTDILKRIGFKFITINNTKKNYLKIEFEKIVDYLNILICNIDFYPVSYSLKVKKINEIDLKEDLHKIKNNIPLNVKKNDLDLETNDNSLNNKSEESNIMQDTIECKVCHEILPKNNFRKILGEYGHVCRNCEDKVLAAKYINIILEYLEPGETFNMDEFIQEHHHQDLSDIIFTLQENDLIKRDFGSNYYLESEDVLNDFKEKYYE